MGKDRSEWPIMVRLSLWGIPNRALAWGFFWLCALLTVACLAYGYIIESYFIVALTAWVGAMGYYWSIRWVDDNSSW